MMDRGEVWWALLDEKRPVVLLSRDGAEELRAIQVVAPAGTDITDQCGRKRPTDPGIKLPNQLRGFDSPPAYLHRLATVQLSADPIASAATCALRRSRWP